MALQSSNQNLLKWGGLGTGFLLMGGASLGCSPDEAGEPQEEGPAAQEDVGEGQAPDEEEADHDDAAAAAGECDLPSDEDSFPTEAPDFEWEEHHGAQVPVSDEHGPVDQDGEFWQCFSQTPTGAAFAGIPLMLDFTLNDAHEAGEDSPATDAAFEEAQNYPEDVDVLFQGFRVNEASDDHASVTYWMTSETDPAAGDAQMTLELVWDEEDGDWRLDLTGGLPDMEPLNDASGFVQWR